ncbi:TetR/AcrR family transcriptional regulator [Streptomyces sp. NPDC059637]|uniref:TetR/AcrR family transcriptional regulator n=1 Tax=Streptomyces sp. NPDC059637 TaxID=3347752 RepID=UPI0036BC9F2E
MPEAPNRADERADRILDAAGELLLRLGARKVTVEDIADRAGVGKGTVYLHWRTKEQLLEAVVLRDSVGVTGELLEQVRENPFEVLPHRFMRSSYLATFRSPLTAVLVTDTTGLLGRIKTGALRESRALAADRYFDTMRRYGLLRTDVPGLAYALQATASGFYLVDNLGVDTAGLDREAKADALARTVRCAFEPAGEPEPAAVAAAAAALVAMFEELTTSHREWIYSNTRHVRHTQHTQHTQHGPAQTQEAG